VLSYQSGWWASEWSERLGTQWCVRPFFCGVFADEPALAGNAAISGHLV